MSYEHKEGSGSLFRNKKTKDSQPDIKGQFKIGGIVYDIALWEQSKKPGPDYSVKVSIPRPVGSRVPTGGRNDPRPEKEPEFNDDIPFKSAEHNRFNKMQEDVDGDDLSAEQWAREIAES